MFHKKGISQSVKGKNDITSTNTGNTLTQSKVSTSQPIKSVAITPITTKENKSILSVTQKQVSKDTPILKPSMPLPKKEEIVPIGASHKLDKLEIPKSGPLNRIKNGKDIPVTIKGPRRQRSSRFHITEPVNLEKLSAFKGFKFISLFISLFRCYSF